ncbi:hypothetical protein B0T19DRAFT_108505 [Cercophora scortea]|uniref:Uncharacterized protein n=1 Tax=Cercophora scortea TaxID=314031 RepID=A0AAE0MHG4_9PEZI|nr:hypothetical protein B0T19DRAFT_108505 [Cercophora scortea]
MGLLENSRLLHHPKWTTLDRPKMTTIQNRRPSEMDDHISIQGDPLRDLVKSERRHPGPTCNYLASRRNNYGNIPFGEFIPLALYATVPDLERLTSHDVERLAQIASQRHKAKNGDFIKALSKYCKNLDSLQQAAALFEGAIYLVEKTIEGGTYSVSPETIAEDREHWVLVSRAQLQLLQLSHPKANDDGLNGPHDPGEAVRITAVAANVGGLERIFGDFLRVGFNTSSMRKEEGGKSFTEAVRLHMAPAVGEDFTLEIRIGFGAGKAIAQLISTGDDLRDVLGNYLYEVTKTSKTKPPVRLTWIDMDCNLELMLGFVEGEKIYHVIFPRL